MDKDILAAGIGGDKPEALVAIEPLHGSVKLGGRGGIWTIAARCHRGGRSPGRPSCNPAGIDPENSSYLPSFLANANVHLKLGIRFHCLMSGCLQHGDVQENVARAVSQRDEPKALFRIEPFDRGVQ